MRTTNLLITACILTWLTSCATLTPRVPTTTTTAQNEKMSWEAREQQLLRINNWDMKSKIAIRKANDAWTASLDWQQTGKSYHISLFGPLGTNHYELNGQPGQVTLLAANGKQSSASSPEALLQQQVGWSFPVSNLYYWVRGIPVPGIPAQKQLDNFNHLINLQQEGWNIQFLRYTSINNIDIPDKIFLDNPQLNVKIIVNQWQLY